MKKAVLLFLFAFTVLAVSCFAQTTPTPAPLSSGNVFTVSAGYANMASTATNNGFQITGILTLHEGTYSLLGLRADTMLLANPNVTMSLIGPEYQYSIAHLFKSSTAVTQNVVLFAHAGAGEAFFTSPTATESSHAKFALGIGGGIQVNVSPTMFIRPLDITWVHSSIPGTNAVIGNQAQFAASFGLSWK
jgi:opacity protein-like surface antigen